MILGANRLDMNTTDNPAEKFGPEAKPLARISFRYRPLATANSGPDQPEEGAQCGSSTAC